MGLFVKSQYYMQYGGPIITFKRLHIFFFDNLVVHIMVMSFKKHEIKIPISQASASPKFILH